MRKESQCFAPKRPGHKRKGRVSECQTIIVKSQRRGVVSLGEKSSRSPSALEMRIDPVFESVFRRVYGKPCWHVSQGVGTFLTLEFGNPHLHIIEPTVAKGRVSERVRQNLTSRRVFVNGDWHLWIYCCNWEVRLRDKPIGGSSLPSSIQRAASLLDGQKLLRFSMAPKTSRCVFEFDLGAVLQTSPYDDRREQWLFYDSRLHRVLTLRADGCYAFGRSDRAGPKRWKPVWLTASREPGVYVRKTAQP